MSKSSNISPSIDHVPASQPAIITRKQDPVVGSDTLLHELASLLDACLRNVQLVIRQFDDPQRVSPSSVPHDLIDRLRVALNGLTDMATLMQRWSGSSTHTTGLFDQGKSIHQTAQQAIRLLTPTAMLRGISLNVDLPDALSHQPAGPLFPVLFNAIRNGIEAISVPHDNNGVSTEHPPTMININGHADEANIVLTVTDNGPGISPDMLDLDGNVVIGRTSKPDGHGLGLALCRDVVESLGGTIALRNHEPKGAQLTICLPPNLPPG